jgi:hypothetical protein
MPISISSEVLGTLSVTIAETTGTLSVSVLATAPAVLSVELGTPGPAATIAIGTVTALAPDATPTVVNSGTNLNAVLDFGFPSGSTTQVRAQVRNETGATLAKGTVVYINGGAGNKVTVTKAIATGDETSAQTFGIVITDITNNQNGYVCVLGLVENLNTSAYTEGQQLYLSPTTAGAWTTTKPSAPNHMVYIGIVERVHVNQGTVLVRIQNGYELEELHNVAIASVANGDLLVYESATDLWKNKSAATAGILTTSLAASTYQTIAGMSAYLTTASAASTYYPLTNPSGFITSAALSGYLLASTAAATYQTLAGMSAYLTTASAASTYQTQAAMSAYLTSATAASTYQTLSGMSSYLTSATAASTYQPIGSYLTDAPSDGSTYGRKDGAWYAVASGGGTWGSITGTLSAQTDLQAELDAKAPLSGPAFSGTATFTGTGGTVSLNDGGLDLSASTGGGLVTVGTSGITFSDSTTQQTAFNPDRAMADAIANIIYTQSSGSTGDICFSNVPQFISNLTTNWGIVDSSLTYENCTGFSGVQYSLSGSVGSGPYKVRVNGIDSSFTI